jgi:hypothetical protein
VLVGRLVVSLVLASAALASSAHAQDRSRSGRSRMELAFDHGYGVSSEGEYAELAVDARLYAPFGLGLVVRTGLATQLFSNAVALDLGLAYRVDLVAGDHAGLQLALAAGGSAARGPFDGGDVWALGVVGMLHLDFWYRNFFVGIGASSHALWPIRAGEDQLEGTPRTDPLWTLTPTIRIGGEWGL